MTFTLVATAEPSHEPPRVLLEATEDDPTFIISSCDLFRDGVASRFAFTVTGSSAVAYDYDAGFDATLTYRADATETGIVEAWNEPWPDVSAWTDGGIGAGWSATAGVASAAADGSTIYRDLGGPLASLLVTSPSILTVQLLNASALLIGQVQVSPNGKVTITAGTTSSVVGSGTFTLTVAGSSLAIDGSGWSTTVDLNGDITRIKLVAPSVASYVSQFGSLGSGNGAFNTPSAIAIDGSGNYFVTDTTNNRVQKFNSSGVYQAQVGVFGTGNGQFNAPIGIDVDGSGNVFIVDQGNNRVQKFNNSLVYQSQFGAAGTGNGQFASPAGLTIDGSGNIYVADMSNHRVQKFNSAGTYQSKFGTSGTGNGQFNKPRDIAFDGSGNIFVVDFGNNRVQKFNSGGTYQSQFGTLGSGNGQFSSPQGIAIDASGDIFVVDQMNNRIQKFTSGGAYVSKFGSLGSGQAQFSAPKRVQVDASDNLVVVDTGNNRVQKFTQAGASVDDITATITNDMLSVSATDTATLTGISPIWLTNAAQPELALAIDDCSAVDPDFYLTDETRRQTTARSSSVQLDIEGSADVLTVVTGPRRRETTVMEVFCKSDANRRELLALLANNAALNLRVPASMSDLGLDDGFYAVGDVTTSRDYGPRISQQSVVSMPLTPSRAPAFDALWEWNWDALAQTGLTWDQAAAVFPTWDDLLIGPTT